MNDNPNENTARLTDGYYDLHVTGLGYLNRVREVKPPRGKAFLAASIGALHGPSDEVQKTWFDVRVSGQEAQRVIRELMPDAEAGKAVLIGFRLGDLTAETFVYEKGPKQGQTGVTLKARLLKVAWAKVDGKTVYTAPKEAAASAGEGRDEALARAA